MIRLGRSLIPGQGVAKSSVERRLSYQPALDGMRALAVAAVLAYHAGLPWARGGFLGVDAFFVLSGFLITSLLLAEWRSQGGINLAAFWARRARRLLPALFLVLLGVGAYALVFAEPDELTKLRGDALATIGYVANWRPIFTHQSYFDQFAVPSPLRHTWSLAIEEQWYAVWPLIVLLLLSLRRGSLRMLLPVALVLLATSAFLMARLYNPGSDPSRVYYGTDTRAQSLLVGSVLAMLLSQRGAIGSAWGRGLLQLAAVACAAYIGWVWTTTSDDSGFLYRGGLLTLALAVAIVIAAVTQSKTGPLGRVLSLPPLRGLGIISYGVYLWHWPLYLVLTPDRVGWDGYGLFAARVAVTLAVATASYHFLEMPFRRGALRRWRASWTLAPAAAAALAVVAVVVTRGVGPTLALSVPSPEGMSASAAMPDASGSGAAAPVRVLAVGDSVALTMALGLQRLQSQWNLSVWDVGTLGCGFVRADEQLLQGKWAAQREFCNDWPDRWRSYVDAFQPDVVVMLVGAWDTSDLKRYGRLLEFGTPEADAYILSELGTAVDVLSSGGAKVILLTTPYFKQLDLGVDGGRDRPDDSQVDRLNALYAELAQQRPDRVTLVDLNGLVSPGGEYTGSIDGVNMRGDGVHFTVAGADFVARWLGPQLAAIGGEQPRVSSAPGVSGDAASGEWPASHWLDLLRQVPDTSEARAATVMNDYARFRAAFGLPLPDPTAGESALFDYYRRLLFDAAGRASGTAPADITGITEFPPLLDETRAQLGFSIADVDQDVWVRWGDEEHPFQVLRGRFDRQAIDQAVHADPASAALLEAVSHSGVGYYRWGTGSEGGGAGVAQCLGAGHELASLGDYLYWSGAENGVEAMIDAGLGVGGSLADVEGFRLLAQELDQFNTYTALFSDDTASYSVPELTKSLAGPDASDDELSAIRTDLESQAKLLPYQAFATGAGVDADGPYMALILLTADEEVARENAQRLRDRIDGGVSWLRGQPFRESIHGADIVSDGRLVVAKLRIEERNAWVGLFAVKNTLILHE